MPETQTYEVIPDTPDEPGQAWERSATSPAHAAIISPVSHRSEVSYSVTGETDEETVIVTDSDIINYVDAAISDSADQQGRGQPADYMFVVTPVAERRECEVTGEVVRDFVDEYESWWNSPVDGVYVVPTTGSVFSSVFELADHLYEQQPYQGPDDGERSPLLFDATLTLTTYLPRTTDTFEFHVTPSKAGDGLTCSVTTETDAEDTYAAVGMFDVIHDLTQLDHTTEGEPVVTYQLEISQVLTRPLQSTRNPDIVIKDYVTDELRQKYQEVMTEVLDVQVTRASLNPDLEDFPDSLSPSDATTTSSQSPSRRTLRDSISSFWETLA